MKKALLIILAGLLAMAIAGCSDESPKQQEQSAPAQMAQPAAQGKTGTVTETMNAGGYTYVQFDTGSEKIWAAAPEVAVKVGDPVIVPEGMLMQNHTSKSLDRTFDQIYFVDSLMVGGAQAAAADGAMPPGHPDTSGMGGTEDHARPAVTATDVDLSGLSKPAGGKTVGEIFGGKDNLSGQEVTLRGKVVKFSPEIMGTNWLHIQDGTGEAGNNDLTVTSSTGANVGDTVMVKGIVTLNKDFGFGYKYDVIIENAQVTVE